MASRLVIKLYQIQESTGGLKDSLDDHDLMRFFKSTGQSSSKRVLTNASIKTHLEHVSLASVPQQSHTGPSLL